MLASKLTKIHDPVLRTNACVYLYAHIHRSFVIYSFSFLTFVLRQSFQAWADTSFVPS